MFDYKKTYNLPFKYVIPDAIDKSIIKGLAIKSRIKYLKRYLYALFKGQKSLEVFEVSNNYKNILWINFSAPSLGDSLMDLSSRVLLAGKKLDLLTGKKNANLYSNDLYFSSVFSSYKDVISENYDLVILDSYSTRCIAIKAAVAPLLPFVGLYGYYNGPEVNRVLFSFHQINNLIGYMHTENEINNLAKCSLSISINDKNFIQSLKLPKKFIAIVIGGDWKYRTYNKWIMVIEELLLKDINVKLILLGSDNAKETEKKIQDKFSSNNLLSFVSKITFKQTAEIIRQSNVLFCCDSGLMHAANALDAMVIPLFARVQPEMRLTIMSRAFPLFDLLDVNNISVKDVMLRYVEATNSDHNHPLSE